jgi:ABC-type uncharacterized transport system substrate-binding protein
MVGLKRLGILTNPDNPSHPLVLKAARSAAEQAGLDLTSVEAKNQDEITRAFVTLILGSMHGLVVPDFSLRSATSSPNCQCGMNCQRSSPTEIMWTPAG